MIGIIVIKTHHSKDWANNFIIQKIIYSSNDLKLIKRNLWTYIKIKAGGDLPPAIFFITL